jgi:hypothetical protein
VREEDERKIWERMLSRLPASAARPRASVDVLFVAVRLLAPVDRGGLVSVSSVENPFETHNLSCGLDQNFAEFCRPIRARMSAC